ncbi:SIR2 family NAD-dependent protein deacylase [Paenibacillus sp. BJ-4]|uniref:SIR2 family NAD-dependent protein deacylase n=1 Tax=Paenibacillus sp. BJ-4 TaxID=2878097 RepID=UPI001CF0AF4A|nr:SIR2 family protein [Paenibacillus sp. BJ-4]
MEIGEFDDEQGYIHLSVMNMGVPVIYTTNQDNVMELGYKKYGKKYRSIINLPDFAEIKVSEQLYIKFHGDLNHPNSIVFTEQDYQNRIQDVGNALNIRLRADLIEKNILFIGYGFRDINIRLMFEELNKAFFGSIPKAYLVAYKYSNELQEICDEYNIVLIDPMKEIPDSENFKVAFETFIRKLTEDTRFIKHKNSMDEFFNPTSTETQKVLSKLELEILEKTVCENTFDVALRSFREVFDLTIIPHDYDDRVKDIFIEIAKKVENEKESNTLSYALVHLKLNKHINKMLVYSALMTTGCKRSANSKYGENHFIIIGMNGIKESSYILIAAKAIELVYDWGWKPTAPFVSNIGHWVDRSGDYNSLTEPLKRYISSWIDKLRKDCVTVAEHPIKRQQRLKEGLFSHNMYQFNEAELTIYEQFINCR